MESALTSIDTQTITIICIGSICIHAVLLFAGVIAQGIFTALNYKMYTEYFKDISRTKAFENGNKKDG